MAIDTSWKPVSVPDLGGSSFLSLAGTLNKNAIEALNNITSQAQKQLELQQQQKEFEVRQGLEQLKFELEKDKFNQQLKATAWEQAYKTKEQKLNNQYRNSYLELMRNNTQAAAKRNQYLQSLFQAATKLGRKPYQPRTVDKEEYQFTADLLNRWVKEGKLKPKDKTVILNNLDLTDPQLGVLYKAIQDKDTFLNNSFNPEELITLRNSHEKLLAKEIPYARDRRKYNNDIDQQGEYYGSMPGRSITDAVKEKVLNTSDTNKGPFGY